jgi:hypothetical protein
LVKVNLQSNELEKLSKLLNSEEKCQFLGYSLNVKTAKLEDLLAKTPCSAMEIFIVTTLLRHYLEASPITELGKLVKFEDLPGGHSYGKAFTNRAIAPIVEGFGRNPVQLIQAAKRLGGTQLPYGDASVEIPTLRSIPLVYILWEEMEFPASANVLFYSSSSVYLPTEDLAILGELVSHRLLKTRTENVA